MEKIQKNFPQPTVETKPFWDGCKQHQLLIQQCGECGHYQFYPRTICTKCMSQKVNWVEASGLGRVKTYTIVHRPISPAYMTEAPYILALVELDEGPTMMTNIINCPLDEVKVGMRVSVTFADWSINISVPQFVPMEG